MSNVLHEQDSQFLKFYVKCVNCDTFSRKLRIEDVLLIIFPTQIQTNSGYFVKSYIISFLNTANYTKRVFFSADSSNIYPSPKIFYTSHHHHHHHHQLQYHKPPPAIRFRFKQNITQAQVFDVFDVSDFCDCLIALDLDQAIGSRVSSSLFWNHCALILPPSG